MARTPHDTPQQRLARLTGLGGGAGTAARAPFVLLVVTLLGAGMLALLVLNASLNQGSFRLDELRQQNQELTDERQELQAEVDGFSAPDALARQAREQGLVPSGPPVFLEPDGTVRGAPEPAPEPEDIPEEDEPRPAPEVEHGPVAGRGAAVDTPDEADEEPAEETADDEEAADAEEPAEEAEDPAEESAADEATPQDDATGSTPEDRAADPAATETEEGDG